MAARLLSNVDTWVREKRPYKAALSREAALNIMTEGDGRTRPEMFDPDLLATFSDNHRRMSDAFSLVDGISAQANSMLNALPFGCDGPPDDPSALDV